ncbi:MAG: DUF4435 domain-containing protein [Prevotellaceae bacterium]|jgi:hypothetical protein|nr:DUF4435 domain-containing protein [Prevotellaceae bacterium]
MMPGNNFYRKWARWYTDQTYLKRLDAIVHVEGETDKIFWKQVLAHAGLNVRAVSGSDNREDQTSGKKQCMKYRAYLNPRFFICIDSDYDYLKQAQPLYGVKDFILQTYTYAIENHYLASNPFLQDFLQAYSRTIYPAFLAHLNDNSPIDEFCRFIVPSANPAALEALQRRIKKRLHSQLSNRYAASGLTADNAYLYIKAKLLKSILRCKENLSFTHFPMNKILEDAAQIGRTR